MNLDLPGPQAVRKLGPGKLVIASHNEGKVREIRALLAHYGVDPVSAKELDLPEPVENGTTFFANAEIKARSAADLSGLPALADDSGLSVDALGGNPGVYTADWAETPNGRDWALAMRKVEDALAGRGPDAGRDAHFTSVLSVAWPDGHVESFEGRAHGTLVWPPRGERGFGYDPILQPEGRQVSTAQLSAEEKNAISHRGEAFTALLPALVEALRAQEAHTT